MQSDIAYFYSPFGDHPKDAEPSVTNAGDAVTSRMTSPSDVMLVSAPLERSSKGVKSVLEESSEDKINEGADERQIGNNTITG